MKTFWGACSLFLLAVGCGGSARVEGGDAGSSNFTPTSPAKGGSGGAGSAGASGSSAGTSTGGTGYCIDGEDLHLDGSQWDCDCGPCHCVAGNISKPSDCPGCVYDGLNRFPGSTFPATDGCNTCTCTSVGNVQCTRKACPACTYAGREHYAGEKFPAVDGCNTCQCEGNGVSCTEAGCTCDPNKDWGNKYYGTSSKECALIDFECPVNTESIYDQCGCGCAQEPGCPEFVNCIPGASDCKTLTAQCPFSKVLQ